MQYSKPSLTFEQQADLLLSRGLIADRLMLIDRLQCVNYYRLSGYLYPFRLENDTYKNGTTLDQVWQIYTFDRQLRILVMDAIERVEVSVRTQLAYHFAQHYGPFAYTSKHLFPNMEAEEYQKWLHELRAEVERTNEVFIQHFRNKYGDRHADLPIWMLTEVMSFGKTLTFYRTVSREIQNPVALRYHIPHNLLESWLRSLNAVRNICAHHGRLWNRVLGYKPQLPNPKKHSEWYQPFPIPQDKMFVILTILRYLLRFDAPTSRWSDRLGKLITDNKFISLRPYGFPNQWEEHTIWR
jgi:abortive infection bacteriophage resistance protein